MLTDAPGDRFVPGTRFVVEPALAGPLTVESARWNKDILLLAFEEIETRNEAETLRGAKLFIETEDLDDEDDDEGWYEHELEAWRSAWVTRWWARSPASTPSRSRTCWW